MMSAQQCLLMQRQRQQPANRNQQQHGWASYMCKNSITCSHFHSVNHRQATASHAESETCRIRNSCRACRTAELEKAQDLNRIFCRKNFLQKFFFAN
jgi:hypothetical protein